jgi:hypothetical protein
MEKTVSNQNCINEETKHRLRFQVLTKLAVKISIFWDAFQKSKLNQGMFIATKNRIIFQLISRNMKINIYRTVILPVVFMGI